MKIYNSLTFQKEEFKTITPKKVLMYVCGPTVYDSPHLGHAKSAVAFDLVRRYLRFKGYDVKLVKNYTDIDDKIIKRAKEKKLDFKTLSELYIDEYEKVMKLLNIKKDFKNPRATEVIDFIIGFIQKLIEKGNAYERNGSVYFSVKSFSGYGEIFQNIKAGIGEEEEEEDLEDQDTAYGEDKQDRKDFALWKKWKEGEPYWNSPWGKGRPGWHIECSAMTINYLSETIDIHAGGQDLKFPHHRNEISQSEAYTGKKFANYFMHNGFVNIDNEKMSKSLGNFFLVSEVAKEYEPMVIRFFLISSHYRKSINYSLETMNQAKKNYNKIINAIKKINDAPTVEGDSKESTELLLKIEGAKSKIVMALDDDFNTPVAISEIMILFRELNQAILEKKISLNENFKDEFFKFIEDMELIFGLFPNLKNDLKTGISSMIDDKDILIKKLLEIIADTRAKLREKKLFEISDEIREKLNALDLQVEDN